MKFSFSKIVAVTMSFTLVFSSLSPAVFAQERKRLELDQKCCEKNYLLYGNERGRMENNKCVVYVDLDPIDVDPVEESDPDAPPPDEEKNLLEEIWEGTKTGVSNLFGSVDMLLISPFRSLFQSLTSKEPLIEQSENVFNDHTEPYHTFLDEEIFGKAIHGISLFPTAEELTTYFQNQEKESSKGGCGVESPRPDCVIERAMCSYEKYTQVLFEQAGQNFVDPLRKKNVQTIEELDVTSLLGALQKRNHALVEEAEHSRQALDTAIAVYSQFYQTYQLHLRFKEVIDALAKVKDMTAAMRVLVGCLPGKFVGVATTKCD